MENNIEMGLNAALVPMMEMPPPNYVFGRAQLAQVHMAGTQTSNDSSLKGNSAIDSWMKTRLMDQNMVSLSLLLLRVK
jgi:hypothetical protein